MTASMIMDQPCFKRISPTIIRRTLVIAILALVVCNSLPLASSLSFKPTPVFSVRGINGDSSPSAVMDPPKAINGDAMSDTVNGNQPNDEISAWSMTVGDTALRQVQFLASKVAESTETAVDQNDVGEGMFGDLKSRLFKQATKRTRSADVFNNAEYNEYTEKEKSQQKTPSSSLQNTRKVRPQVSSNSKRDEQVWAALSNLELDMQLLDNLAGQKPQLTALELLLLSASVTAASSSPWIMGGKLTEVLPPTAAACKLNYNSRKWNKFRKAKCRKYAYHSTDSTFFTISCS